MKSDDHIIEEWIKNNVPDALEILFEWVMDNTPEGTLEDFVRIHHADVWLRFKVWRASRDK